MKALSVICARAGSKGLKNKCIRRIGDKMVIEYSIEYSLSLGKDIKTVVSTDIKEVIDFCIRNNLEFIRRESHLCQDDTRIDAVLADAIIKYGNNCEYCSLLYGNIPTRYPSLFNKAFHFLKGNSHFDAAISMQNVEKYHPASMVDYNEEILPLTPEIHYRRQKLPQKMMHDGHTLIFKAKEFLQRYNGLVPYRKGYLYTIFGNKIKPVISDELVVEIDTEKDLRLAERIFNCKT